VLFLPLLMAVVILPYGFSWCHLTGPMKFVVLVLASTALGIAREIYFGPHYAAPITSLTLLLVLFVMRSLKQWAPRGRPVGVCLVRAIPVICLFMLAARAGASLLHKSFSESDTPAWWQQPVPDFGRAKFDSQLQRVPGNHLVLVRYGRKHDPFEEWVYNNADIDQSKVVWAREMDPVADQQLINYFSGRTLWRLEADAKPLAILSGRQK
jgi:hypothetical protein